MNNSFAHHPNDLGVNFVPSADPTDPRILTAEELSLNTIAGILSRVDGSGLKLLAPPEVALIGDQLQLSGQARSQLYTQGGFDFDTTLTIAGSSASSAEEFFYLLTLVAIVGGDHDPQLNVFSTQYQGSLTTEDRENTKRYRSTWAIVSSFSLLTSEDVSSLLDSNGVWSANITSLTGFTWGTAVNGDTGQFYAADSQWTVGNYELLPVLELMPLVTIQYYNDFTSGGYTHPPGTAIAKTPQAVLAERPTSCEGSLYRLMAGKLLSDRFLATAVLNLITGATNNNSTPQPGQTSPSPNGSQCLANDQRLGFTNEEWLQKQAVQHVTASLNGQQLLQITATLNTNNPPGTHFSSNPQDHRIFSATGEITELGVFTNLGSTNSLHWLPGERAQVQAGDDLIIVPGIRFPSGSGFNLPLQTITAAYYNGTALDPTNLRRGYDGDLNEYQAPANGEDFILVYGPERAALHYIYKKITVVADGDGTVQIPPTELGNFAFIQGTPGRLDAPIYRDLVAAQSYDALVYYPPRTGEIWQLQISYPPYQGLGSAALDHLNGGVISSRPRFFVHTQGGGTSVFQGEGSLRYSPIAMHLPFQNDSYNLNAPVHLLGEPYPGPQTFRELPLQISPGLALPVEGNTISHTVRGLLTPGSLNIVLENSDGVPLGCRFPTFNDATALYQGAIAFLVTKNSTTLLCVCTYNGLGEDAIAFDSLTGCAIDLFAI